MILEVDRIVQDAVDGFAQQFDVIWFRYHALKPVFFEF
jgi:hypothetical protein